MRNSKSGFTLIELLIVVAIIAILAAIAVPNFLEAQTRSKVSRAKADLRTMATAIESYTVDHNKPPREWHWDFYNDGQLLNFGLGNPSGIIFPGGIRDGVLQHGVSTPIAYITNGFMIDPFVQVGEAIDADQQIFSYMNVLGRAQGAPSGIFGGSGATGTQPERAEANLEWFGTWRILSIGPDRDYFNNLTTPGTRTVGFGENIAYDATNGTISEGNIVRSQKRSDSDQPPITVGLMDQ